MSAPLQRCPCVRDQAAQAMNNAVSIMGSMATLGGRDIEKERRQLGRSGGLLRGSGARVRIRVSGSVECTSGMVVKSGPSGIPLSVSTRLS